MYVVCTDENKVAGISGTAYAIFQTRAEAWRFILANGIRAIAYLQML